jgi:acyl carrier protein
MKTIERQILNTLGQSFGREPELDEPLSALGIDSLGMAELTVELEKQFGIHVDEYVLDVETARDLVDYVEERQK